MPVSNWWTVDDALMYITGGPFLWDGTTPWVPINGNRAVSSDPSGSGYAWAPTTLSASIDAINTRLSALENRLFNEARGVKSWPAVGLLALGATNTQRVTFKTPMPNTNYTPQALLVGGALLGGLSIQSATVIDKSNVDVTIKAGVAVTITLGSVSALVFADAN